jgi:hypothetical protein
VFLEEEYKEDVTVCNGSITAVSIFLLPPNTLFHAFPCCFQSSSVVLLVVSSHTFYYSHIFYQISNEVSTTIG